MGTATNDSQGAGAGNGLILNGANLDAPGWFEARRARAIKLAGIPAASLSDRYETDCDKGLTDILSWPGGSGTVTFPSSPRGGVALVSSTTTANRWGAVAFAGGANGILGNLRTDHWLVAWRCKFSAGDTVSSHELSLAPGAGFLTMTGTNTGVGLQAVNGVLSFILNNGGVLTTIATGWAYDTTLHHDFEITNDGNTVTAYIDGVSVGSSASTNLPTSAGAQPTAVAGDGVTAGTARTVLVDKMACYSDQAP